MVSHFIKRKQISWHSPSVFVQWRHQFRIGFNKTKIVPFYITVKLIVLAPQRRCIKWQVTWGGQLATVGKTGFCLLLIVFVFSQGYLIFSILFPVLPGPVHLPRWVWGPSSFVWSDPIFWRKGCDLSWRGPSLAQRCSLQQRGAANPETRGGWRSRWI